MKALHLRLLALAMCFCLILCSVLSIDILVAHSDHEHNHDHNNNHHNCDIKDECCPICTQVADTYKNLKLWASNLDSPHLNKLLHMALVEACLGDLQVLPSTTPVELKVKLNN